MEVRIPFLGDGVSSATVLSVTVAPGDSVAKDQTILELETDKAVAPIPSPVAGKVASVLVKEGDKVSTGSVVLKLDGNGAGAPLQPAKPAARSATTIPVNISMPAAQVQIRRTLEGTPAAAAPSVRKMADALGLDLLAVPGSGSGGRITFEDLRNYVQNLQQLALQGTDRLAAASPVAAVTTPKATVDFGKWGDVEKQAVSSLRKKIGDKMREAWTRIPHVTQFDEADITHLMDLRKKHNQLHEKKHEHLTLTVLVLKALVPALKKFPQFNASYDEAAGELVLKRYIHMGVAVDTDNGLIVPVVRDIDKKNVTQLAQELNVLAEKARLRKISLDELQGSSFTVSNLGSLGVGFFTPIINAPDVAILGVGAGLKKPVIRDSKGVSRLMLPLALSYDHRVIDGADGARFIRALVDQLENFDAKELS